MMAGFDCYSNRAGSAAGFCARPPPTSSPETDMGSPGRRKIVQGHGRGDDPRRVPRGDGRRARRAVPHDLRRGDSPLRFRQARPAHRAGTGRCRRTGEGLRNSRCSAAANDTGGRVACASPAARRSNRKQIDDYAAHAKFAPKGPGLRQIGEPSAVNSPIAKFFAEGWFDALLEARRREQQRHRRVLRRRRLQQVQRLRAQARCGYRAGKGIFGLVADGTNRCGSPTSRCSEWDGEEHRYVALHHRSPAPAVDSIT